MTVRWKDSLAIFLLIVVVGTILHAAILWMLGRDMSRLGDLKSFDVLLFTAAFVGLGMGSRN
jgi:hypothetical protein